MFGSRYILSTSIAAWIPESCCNPFFSHLVYIMDLFFCESDLKDRSSAASVLIAVIPILIRVSTLCLITSDFCI